MTVCVINYGSGNLASVRNCIVSLGYKAIVSSEENDIDAASHLILPGVGSYRAGMRGLEENNLIDILNYQAIDKQKKILGICLGMQLFSDVGYEDGCCTGLGWIQGKVLKLTDQKNNLRLPHIGWNDVEIKNKSVLLTDAIHDLTFYFVHSYHFIPVDTSIITGCCEYSETFAAVIEHKNFFATQFHPEKSHTAGKLVLSNFLSDG